MVVDEGDHWDVGFDVRIYIYIIYIVYIYMYSTYI
jgi:hypothetical protein